MKKQRTVAKRFKRFESQDLSCSSLLSSATRNEQVTPSIRPVCMWLCCVPRLAPVPEGSDPWCPWWLHQVLLCPFRTAVLQLWSGWRRLNSCLLSLSVRWLTWALRSRTPPSIPWRCRPKSWRRTSSQVMFPFDISGNRNQAVTTGKLGEIFKSRGDVCCTCGMQHSSFTHPGQCSPLA